jgi:TPR repeat protein
MKIIIPFIVLQWFINISFAQTPITNKIALVIGNARYQTDPLKNPENDVTAIADFLKKHGFEVILGTNWTRSQMTQALYDFEQKLKSDGVALFYYAGHGIEHGGHNYLCPIETARDSNLSESDKFVDLDEVLRRLHSKHSYLNLLFLDACRTELSRGTRMLSRGTRIMTSFPSIPSFNGETIISFAAAPGHPAFDGSGNISPYTESVLSALNTPCIKVSDYFSMIVDSVKFKTGNAQIPWVNNSLTSAAAAFSFVGCNRSDQELRLGIEKYEKKEFCAGFSSLSLQESTFEVSSYRDLVDKTAFWLGDTYEVGNCTPKDLQKSLKYYEIAARHNHLEAQYRLGLVYKSFHNCGQTNDWLLKAAQSGHPAAQFEMGLLYEEGKCKPADYQKAAAWYKEAAKKKYAAANYHLGLLYDNGVSRRGNRIDLFEGTLRESRERQMRAEAFVTQDIRLAVEYYRQAADNGHKEAQFVMGTIYENGELAARISKDAAQAFQWYEKAAIQQEPHAQNALGNLYFNGHGVQKSDNQAFTWYLKAAAQGNADAQNNLGQLYFEGKGVSQSDSEAFKWFQKAAEKNLAEAQYNMGMVHLAGRGVPKNGTLAFEWFQKAALQEYVNAEYYLGVLYFQGTGVLQNDEWANDWLQKAANKRFDVAKFYLAKLNQKQGRDKEAFKYFKQVFDSQQVIPNSQRIEAQYELALMYLSGNGIARDENKAANWIRDAADANYAKAQTALGDLYERGIGVPRRNVEQACKYYNLAAQQNEPVAVQKLKTRICN